jgi:hypothetical protein
LFKKEESSWTHIKSLHYNAMMIYSFIYDWYIVIE